MVGKLLIAVSAFLADEADGIELLDFAFRKAERREYGVDRSETRQGSIAAEGECELKLASGSKGGGCAVNIAFFSLC